MRSSFEFGDDNIRKKVSGSIYKGLSRTSTFGFVTDLFAGLIFSIISLGAFSVRVIFRRKIGERSFGIITIILTYIWIRMFYAYDLIHIKSCSEFGLFGGECGALSSIMYVFLVPYYILISMWRNDMDMSPITTEGGIENIFFLFNIEADGGFAGLFSLLFLFFALWALIDVFGRVFSKSRWHSFHRGKSILNRFFLGKKVFGFTIQDFHIWMWIESTVVAIFGVIAWLCNDVIMARVLLVGAACLLIEEYSVYRNERSIVLDLIDQEIDAEHITRIKKQYQYDLEQHRESGEENNSNESEITI